MSFVYYDPQHPLCSIYVLNILFAPSLQVLWSPSCSETVHFTLHRFIHLLFTTHAHTIVTCFAVVPRLHYLFLVFQNFQLKFHVLIIVLEQYLLLVFQKHLLYYVHVQLCLLCCDLLVGWQEGHPACKNWVVRYWHNPPTLRGTWRNFGETRGHACLCSLLSLSIHELCVINWVCYVYCLDVYFCRHIARSCLR